MNLYRIIYVKTVLGGKTYADPGKLDAFGTSGDLSFVYYLTFVNRVDLVSIEDFTFVLIKIIELIKSKTAVNNNQREEYQ